MNFALNADDGSGGAKKVNLIDKKFQPLNKRGDKIIPEINASKIYFK